MTDIVNIYAQKLLLCMLMPITSKGAADVFSHLVPNKWEMCQELMIYRLITGVSQIRTTFYKPYMPLLSSHDCIAFK